MSNRDLILLGLVWSAPLTLALIVAMVRGYTITVHLTRENNGRNRRHHD